VGKINIYERNRKASRNGRNGEKFIEDTYGVKVNRKTILDFPDGIIINGYKIGEIKTVFNEHRNDGGYSRITIERQQIKEMKRNDSHLLLIVMKSMKLFIIPNEILNGNRQISWKKLSEKGIPLSL